MIVNAHFRNQILDVQPLAVWVILSLEITVELSGRHYLLVKYPYYALENQRTNQIEEGHWYPPFVGFAAEVGTFPPQTVGEVVDITERKLACIDAVTQLEELSHAMGFGPPNLYRCGSILEIKASPTFGSVFRAYRIERYRCRPRGFPQIRHITDPECLKGHAFIPLDDLDVLLPIRGTKGRELTFLGKPLISNLQHLVEDAAELKLLKTDPIQTRMDSWLRTECGFVILVDIAGFGTACQFATEKLSNMFDRGDAIADRFRLTIGQCFQRIFAESGIAQSRFTGDGFFAAIPDRMSEDKARLSAVKLFIASYLNFVEMLNQMNVRIAHGGLQIGSRIAIHYGRYRFGRVGGPTSLAADFDGDTLIEVARVEAALSQISKRSAGSSAHSIAMTASAVERLKNVPRLRSVIGKLKHVIQKVKERPIEMLAGRLNTNHIDVSRPALKRGRSTVEEQA